MYERIDMFKFIDIENNKTEYEFEFYRNYVYVDQITNTLHNIGFRYAFPIVEGKILWFHSNVGGIVPDNVKNYIEKYLKLISFE